MNHSRNKLLGQHFLKSRCGWVADALISAADLTENEIVLEIGPGTGALTRILAKHAGRVIAVEKDKELADELPNILKKENITNVEVVEGDILKILSRCHSGLDPESRFTYMSSAYNLDSHLRGNDNGDSYKVVANIPYYLTARLIRLLLEADSQPKCIVITIQKEVAERIIARPPRMSLLALSVQTYGTPKIIATVGPECFSPPPKVESSILQIIPHQKSFFEDAKISQDAFFAIARRAFQQKRKKLSTSLDMKNTLLPQEIKEKRPEALSLEEWGELTRAVSKY